MNVPAHLCTRTREWVSLRLDDELSELEEAQLQAHLARCVECAAYAEDVGRTTRALRAAPHELLSRPLELPRRVRVRVPFRVAQAAAAAAVVLVATVLGAVYGLVRDGGGDSARVAAPSIVVASAEDEVAQLREFRRTALLDEILMLPRNRDLPV